MKTIQFVLVVATAAVVSVGTVRWMEPATKVAAQSSLPGLFHFLPPCRVVDTRDAEGPLGGPEMEAGETRTFQITQSACAATAATNNQAYALNITVVPDGPLGFLTVWNATAGWPKPNVSTLNAWEGQVVANGAIVPAGDNGAINVYVTNRTHVIIDISGYFTSY